MRASVLGAATLILLALSLTGCQGTNMGIDRPAAPTFLPISGPTVRPLPSRTVIEELTKPSPGPGNIVHVTATPVTPAIPLPTP